MRNRTVAGSPSGLFETHLTVSHLGRSVPFYRDVVGLELALEDDESKSAFFWVGPPGRSMLGLWSLGGMPLGLRLHAAFEVSLEDVLAAPARLVAAGVQPLSFGGEPTTEPCLIGWMPAAVVYFEDPDGHSLEYVAMLDQAPRPELGVVPWSAS